MDTPVDPIVERYLEYARVEKRLAKRTLTLYALDLQKLCELTKPLKLELTQVQNQHIRRWTAHMHAQGRTGRGIALILSAWRGFYAWLGREGLVSSNPVQDVKAPKSTKPLPKAMSVDDAMHFANYKSESDAPWLNLRDAAIVELLYGSGLRVGELVSLDVIGTTHSSGWVDVAAAEVHVLGKGGKRRTVPVGSKALHALYLWTTARAEFITQHTDNMNGKTPTNALFIGKNGSRLSAASVWQRLKRRSLQAALAMPVHPHMLRHSFASHVLQSSSDLRAVQELLGHSNIATTQVYTKLDYQHLAKVYDAAHPRARRR